MPLRRGVDCLGHLSNPTPDTGYEPKFCVDVSDEHTPINLPDSNKNFPHELRRESGTIKSPWGLRSCSRTCLLFTIPCQTFFQPGSALVGVRPPLPILAYTGRCACAVREKKTKNGALVPMARKTMWANRALGHLLFSGLLVSVRACCLPAGVPTVCSSVDDILKHMCAWCQYTRGRFERTHGGFSACHITPHAHTTTTTTYTTQHSNNTATSHGDRDRERQRERQRKRDRERETERETRQDEREECEMILRMTKLFLEPKIMVTKIKHTKEGSPHCAKKQC